MEYFRLFSLLVFFFFCLFACQERANWLGAFEHFYCASDRLTERFYFLIWDWRKGLLTFVVLVVVVAVLHLINFFLFLWFNCFVCLSGLAVWHAKSNGHKIDSRYCVNRAPFNAYNKENPTISESTAVMLNKLPVLPPFGWICISTESIVV